VGSQWKITWILTRPLWVYNFAGLKKAAVHSNTKKETTCSSLFVSYTYMHMLKTEVTLFRLEEAYWFSRHFNKCNNG
jgi:hypothetical protein